jgi:hypothetical protein
MVGLTRGEVKIVDSHQPQLQKRESKVSFSVLTFFRYRKQVPQVLRRWRCAAPPLVGGRSPILQAA